MTPADLHQHVDAGAVHLASMLRAARGGVASCQLVSWKADGALLTGSSTRPPDRALRSRKTPAHSSGRPRAADVAHIVEVIRPLEEAGALVRRGRDRLEEEIDQFLVAEIDQQRGGLLRCLSLR